MADASPLPEDVETLLHSRLRSLTQLETLLLVRSAPQTAADIARALRISESHAEDELLSLVALRLLRGDGPLYVYAASAKSRATIDTLAALYPTYRVAVSRAIFSTRFSSRDGDRWFSDASRLRNPDQD